MGLLDPRALTMRFEELLRGAGFDFRRPVSAKPKAGKESRPTLDLPAALLLTVRPH